MFERPITICAILLAVLVTAACDRTGDQVSVPQSADEGGSTLTTYERHLVYTISRRSGERGSDGLETLYYVRQIGYTGADHPLSCEFDAIVDSARAETVLEVLLANNAESTVAKMYALILLSDLRSSRLLRWTEQLRSETEQFWASAGCHAEKITAAAFVSEWIERGAVTLRRPERPR
jgi:hypothetical protein